MGRLAGGMVGVLVAGVLGVPGGAAAAVAGARAWDFNGDGYGDVAFGVPTWQFPAGDRPYRGAIGVLYGSASGVGAEPRIVLGPPATNSAGLWQGFGRVLASGDFDRDGYADLAVGGVDDAAGRGSVRLFFGGRRGLNERPVLLKPPRRAGSKFGFALAAGDFDKDGYTDLFASEVFGGHAWIFRGAPRFRHTRKATKLPVWDKKSYVRDAAAGDFNGDGRDDLVLSWFRRKDLTTRTPNRLSVFPGHAKALRKPVTVKVKAGPGELAVGDLTGDGRAEIAYSLNTRARVWRGTPKGLARSKASESPQLGAGALSIGHRVLALGDAPAARIRLYNVTPSGRFTLRKTLSPGATPAGGYGSSVSLRDFDGDGTPDIAAGIPYEKFTCQVPGQLLHRSIEVAYGSTTPVHRFPLPPILDSSYSVLVLP
ncbi:hypothetical protein GCM10027589_51500 [Actinocorallia lasiicapitis]